MDNLIMLVDDDPLNILMTQNILEKNGYVVQSFPNGQDALQGYHLMPCPIILMDCEMPVMDGYDTTRAIRDIEHENNLPPSQIIAITSHVQDENRDQCFNSGMNDFFPKPYKSNDLIDIIKQVFSPPLCVIPPSVSSGNWYVDCPVD